VIAADLREAIDAGRYGPGVQLPSARVLAERYGVAKATATAAVDALKREGLVIGRTGAGWFVAASVGQAAVVRARLDADARAAGYVVEQVQARPATADEAKQLGLSAGAPVLAVRRVAVAPNGAEGEAATAVLPTAQSVIYELPPAAGAPPVEAP
jgi:GntR family transcriptional regulator